eukprot:11172449-Lingulodinium_polyedra.AAC.1
MALPLSRHSGAAKQNENNARGTHDRSGAPNSASWSTAFHQAVRRRLTAICRAQRRSGWQLRSRPSL